MNVDRHTSHISFCHRPHICVNNITKVLIVVKLLFLNSFKFLISRMSSSEDSYDFDCYYYLEYCGEHHGPPLIKKRSRLIAAVVQNDVESLKELLDSPKWYNVKDKSGYTLLQIAIYRENKEVFDYMLSIEDFHVDAANIYGETPLQIALTGYVNHNDDYIDGYYAYELLKKDVKIDIVCKYGQTLLHYAFHREFADVARLLVEKGADLNALTYDGYSPLDYCLRMSSYEDIEEGVSMLLCNGADPFIHDSNGELPFDYALHKSGIELAQEILFYYTFDEQPCQTISLHSLLNAAKNKCPFFYQLMEKISKVNCNNSTLYDIRVLFTVELYYVKALMEKFSYAFEEFFSNENNERLFNFINFNEQSLQNIELFINSKFRSAIIEMICKTDSNKLINSFIRQNTLSLMSEIVCYFLSYGMIIEAEDFHLVYKKFGFGELFKILLHMDVKEFNSVNVEIVPALFYSVQIYNIGTYLQHPDKFITTESCIEELLSYSAHPKLKEFCQTLDHESVIAKAKNLPDVPLLMELARDVFREYFIKKFNITTSKQFYMKLKLLPVSEIHRKIITLETKLYY